MRTNYIYAIQNPTRKMRRTKTPLGFWDTNRSPNLGKTTRPRDSQKKKKKKRKKERKKKEKKKRKKKRTCRIVDFVVPADHRVKLKESEKRDKYLHLARELKKL